ncbi:YhcN/YlaJ family sporulation lipoprotein [Desulforamulus hydrothermalis]|uniref:Sporulation lipoprotein YhcN/YlaJ-like protein n=1 Tax=Desulforamulus hydrothermalis Lam5 = DSM 18033 TaxID=1121428 RepID=K8DXG7_9FIRM|nr:YhcN/YlaJ family sporulation lipoprotein [Desulforamulus hydrothermalis]CCO07322.1 Sporulation lipoprotein YhcN/YlaJ-like protein [Desulforamulus hydrothermalis Lam5 = DSM 18033]SHG94022.1 Sporulation lipoprotein YhcN/YlaJ (Spore_YhcN_YlaJ) [Desulforamulus hydrothermalis Lam5 = DSM 18033]
MKTVLKIFLLFLLCLSLTGCQTTPGKKPEVNTGCQAAECNPELAEQAKQAALSVKGVEDAVVVAVNKNISAAIKVTGFNRLKLQSIEQEVHRKIAGLDQQYEVHVTSDKKLFSQLQAIEKQIKASPDRPAADLLPRLEKINQAMQG